MTLHEQLNSLSGIEFEQLCASLVAGLGFQIELTKASGDGGIDIIANSTMPLYRGKYIIQCKRYTGTVGEPILRDLYGVVMAERANKGILMTTGTFTKSATAFAEGKPLELIDISGIEALIDQGNYEINGVSASVDVEEITAILEKAFREMEFCDLQEELAANPTASDIRAKIGFVLFKEATDSYNLSDFSIEDRRRLLNASVYYLDTLTKKDIGVAKDKSAQLQSFVCVWCAAQGNFLIGNIAGAEQCYQKALNWEELQNSFTNDNGLLDYFCRLIIDVAFFYSITGNKRQASLLLQHPLYSRVLTMKKAALENDIRNAPDESRANYWAVQLMAIENILEAPQFYLLDFDGEDLFNGFPLYQKALNCYDTSALSNLLAPDPYNVELSGKSAQIFTYSGETVMIIDNL